MFRLSYPAIIRELIIVDNKELVASYGMVITQMLQFVLFAICRFKNHVSQNIINILYMLFYDTWFLHAPISL
jgi:hypothetical protein